MAILEKEVWVGVVGNNMKYYENIGYLIPREKDNKGRLRVPKGTRILVKVNDLPSGSEIKLTKICDVCGEHIPNQQYFNILKLRNNNKDICKNCSHKKRSETRLSQVLYKNSLEYYAKTNDKNYLLNEFSQRNKKSPHLISKGSGKKYWWICPSCKSEYTMSVQNRTCGNGGCSYCSSQKVNHTNCLMTTHPDIAKNLKDVLLSYDLTAGTHQKEIFKCVKCGHEEKRQICVVTRNDKYKCTKCSDGVSYPEKFIMSVLSQLKIEFIYQKKFNWSKNKRYDFYIPSYNTIIETHGIQHYEESNRGRSLKEEQENDKLKEDLAEENGIKNYVVLDCRKSELKWIKKGLINSRLSGMVNFDNVNWNECNNYAFSHSLIKEVSNMWGKGVKSTSKIGNILNISSGTVVRYLKQGSKLNWCDYDSVKSQSENGFRCGKNKAKQIVQLTNKNNFVKEWNSATEVNKVTDINKTHIGLVCKGKRKTAGGYKWMYKEDYEKYIAEQKEKEVVTT